MPPLADRLTIATVAADADALRWCRVIALCAGAETVLAIDARDGRGLAERAAAFRARAPRAILVVGGRGRAGVLADVVAAARVGLAGADAPPLVLCAAHPAVGARAQEAAEGALTVARASAPRASGDVEAVARLRALRRTKGELTLERLERDVAALGTDDALAIHVDTTGTRVVLGVGGRVTGVELPGLGVGRASDEVVRRVGARAIRRWLPLDPLPDAASLRDVLANIVRADRVPPSPLVDALTRAVVREAMRLAFDAVARDLALPALKRPRRVVLAGVLAELSPGQAVLAFLDTAPADGVMRVSARGRDVALAVAARPGREGLALRLADDRGESRALVPPGELAALPTTGRASARLGRHEAVEADAPELGVVVDARARPLALPEREAERVPLLASWSAALEVPA